MGEKKDKFCCNIMEQHILLSFGKNGEIKYDEVDVVMNKWPNGTYGIPIHDGGTSLIVINFCPWCGMQLNKKINTNNGNRMIELD